MTAAEGRERRVVVLLGCSGEAGEAGSGNQALAHARKAHAQAAEFLPATLRVVGLLIGQGKNRPASRLIHNAWSREPHPELARLYRSMFEADEPIKRVRRIERLASFNPDHAESHIALAEAALEAELWGNARAQLERAAGDAPPARVCRLMADLEEAENGNIEAAREWLLKAATAEPDPSWMCTSCGAAWLHWSPICGKCDALGMLDWRTPERARDAVRATLIAPDPAIADQAARETDDDGEAQGEAGDETIVSDPQESPPTNPLPVFLGRRLTLSK